MGTLWNWGKDRDYFWFADAKKYLEYTGYMPGGLYYRIQ